MDKKELKKNIIIFFKTFINYLLKILLVVCVWSIWWFSLASYGYMDGLENIFSIPFTIITIFLWVRLSRKFGV